MGILVRQQMRKKPPTWTSSSQKWQKFGRRWQQCLLGSRSSCVYTTRAKQLSRLDFLHHCCIPLSHPVLLMTPLPHAPAVHTELFGSSGMEPRHFLACERGKYPVSLSTMGHSSCGGCVRTLSH